MPDDKIKLGIDYGEAKKDTVDLAGVLDKLKSAAVATGHTGFADLISKTKEAADSFKEISKSAEESGPKAKIGLSEIGAGASALFTAIKEGKVGDAIQSVSEFIALVPGLNTFAPAIKLAGTAAASAYPLLKEWYEYLVKIDDKLISSAQNTTKYANALEEANAALRTTDEIEKARAADKAAGEEVPDKQKARAEVFERLVKGRDEATHQEVYDAIRDTGGEARDARVIEIKKHFQAFRAEQIKRGNLSTGGKARGLQEQVLKYAIDNQEQEALRKVISGEEEQTQAQDLIKQARKGDPKALQRLQEILPEGSTTRDVARMSSQEELDAQRQSRRNAEDERRASQKRDSIEKAERAKKDAEDLAKAEKAEKGMEDLAEQRKKQELGILPVEPSEGKGPAMLQENAPSDLPELDIKRDIGPLHPGRATPVPVLPPGMLPLIEKVVMNQEAAAVNDNARIQKIQQMANGAGAMTQNNRSNGSNGFQN